MQYTLEYVQIAEQIKDMARRIELASKVLRVKKDAKTVKRLLDGVHAELGAIITNLEKATNLEKVSNDKKDVINIADCREY